MDTLKRGDARLTRRSMIGGGLAAPLLPKWAAASLHEAHIAIADYARTLPRPKSGRLRVLVPSGSEANLSPIATAFEELTGYPVDVISTQVRDVATALLLDKLLEEDLYDVALPATYDLPDLAKAKAIQSLDPFSNARRKYHREDSILYSEGDLFDGEVYGYQTDGDAYIMFYNRRFFDDDALTGEYNDKFGTAFAPPADWETYDQQVKFVSGREDGRKGALLARATGYVEWEWWLRLHAQGVWPLSPDLRPQIAGSEGVAALEDMISLKSSLEVERGGLNALFLRWEDFEKGNVYSTISWGGSQKYHLRAGGPISKDLVHTVIPGGRGPNTPDALPYFNWGWSYTVTEATQDAELAHAFCLFAVSSEMSLRAVRKLEGFFDPFRREHYQDPEIQRTYGARFLKIHRLSMENAMPDFYLAERAAYFSSLSTWIGLALAGHETPKEAMKRVSEAWDTIGQSGDKAIRVAQWKRLRAKYPRAIAEKLRDLSPY